MASALNLSQREGLIKPDVGNNHSTVALCALLLALVSLSAGCAKPLLTCPRAAKVPEPPLPQQRPAAILFASDRAPESDFNFSGEMNISGTRMTYGALCEDPLTGARPACQKPPWLKEELPTRLEKKDFLDGIRAANSDVVLFVHGFNISFNESIEVSLRMVQRTGILAIPVAYSWPSRARFSAYGADYDRNEWTIEHLQDFIQDVISALPEGKVLHVVAHSMGNRALLDALLRTHLPERRLGQLIMIAPDVDSEIFKDEVLRAGPFRRKTLYVSRHDLALRAAGWLRSGLPRAGDANEQYVVVKGLDTIDTSPLKAGKVGHSVYDYSQLVFDDIGAVLRDQQPAARKLIACTVKSIDSYNAAHATQLPCEVYQFPSLK